MSRISSLRLDIEECREDAATAHVRYTRHIVVERAPALFDIGCTDADCLDGGYDVTAKVMRALRASSTEFTGEDRCFGRRHGETCGSRLVYRAHATYDAPVEEPSDTACPTRR